MELNKKSNLDKVGFAAGFVIMYFIFTTILFYLLKILGKFPESWGYFHITAITLTLVLIGTIIKLILG